MSIIRKGLVTPSGLANRLIVTKSDDLAGILDSTKEYFIDGIIDMGNQSIEIPAGGLYIKGFNFDISGLTSTEPNFTLFTSPSGGSGNLLMADCFIDISGTNSQVYDIVSETGFEAVEVGRINYNNCTSLGTIDSYRQGLEEGTGRFGGSPSLTLKGSWVGGYRATTTIIRNLSAMMTEPVFKAGDGFVMQSRFLTDINCDLPALSPLLDFAPANFPNSSTLQLVGCIVTRDGISNASDTNITPNISHTNLSSRWKFNNGLLNTFVGGAISVSTEANTVIAAINTPVDIAGLFAETDLQHFDSPSDGVLRHTGNTPLEFNVAFDFSLDGTKDKVYKIHLIVNNGITDTEVFTQSRVINNLAGGRDEGYFSGSTGVFLSVGNTVRWQVSNLSSSQNCTLETDSVSRISER
jgi:hypothetical protein